MVRRVITKFENKDAAGAKEGRCLLDQATVDFDARGPAEKRYLWLVVADFALKLGRFVSRNVGRIADDDIERRTLLASVG